MSRILLPQFHLIVFRAFGSETMGTGKALTWRSAVKKAAQQARDRVINSRNAERFAGVHLERVQFYYVFLGLIKFSHSAVREFAGQKLGSVMNTIQPQ